MTRDSPRPADIGHGHSSIFGSNDTDLIFGLWEEAPFAKLPWDAPNELRELVDDIDNPKRVYAIHKASRRHNFQLLIQKYVVQLREGCGADYCTTSTCFTCRKRIVGRAPIRRYSPTSARTLAIYLASQDNPEAGLCPALKIPRSAPVALNSLVFTPNNSYARDERLSRAHKSQERSADKSGTAAIGKDHVSKGQPSQRTARLGNETRATPDRSGSVDGDGNVDDFNADLPKASFSISERPSSMDYRSFAANVFGTVAFKMLEWLTPSGIEEMTRKAQGIQSSNNSNGRPIEQNDCKSAEKSATCSPPPTALHESSSEVPRSRATRDGIDDAVVDERQNGDKAKEYCERTAREDQLQGVQKLSSRTGSSRRNSNAQVRRSSVPKPKRQLSIDPVPHEVLSDESYAPHVRSPRPNGPQGEKSARSLKTTAAALARPISQLSSAGFFDEVPLEKMPPPPPKAVEIKLKSERSQADGARSSGSNSPKTPVSSLRASLDTGRVQHGQDFDSDDESLLPQTLSRLNADVVNFICDVIQEDGSGEKHLLEPATVVKFDSKHGGQGKALKRKPRTESNHSVNIKAEWKLFVEQSIFYVLSDPQLVIQSFTKKGKLYDSHTLWYCMLRLTRIAPSLVFHSLWLAAAGLFAPPRSLQSLRSPTARLFPRQEKSLSNADAGYLVSICLHALVAAAPLVSDSQKLYDMSRIRSHGLSLAGSGAIARQPPELCLQYDDTFNNDLAVRLARRLFAAITTRRYFDDMHELSLEGEKRDEPDVLGPLFFQLDFLNSEAVYILDFPVSERTLHETRVPTLLLDWAKAIMLKEWDGNPEIPGDGPFGGALALMEAMYQRRQELLLVDARFKCEYFADRLDSVEMPVTWLSHTSNRQKLHLLDFPYLFNTSTLVSYFRSINFSRMSRSFEESSSLQSRMAAIMSPGSLIVNPHHKDVLQDFLGTASSKYLILDISRDNVVRDAFDQLWRRQERELLRPLKVHLGEGDGEEGFDSGGVQQEFFRMAISEVLNPDYGAFTVDERTRMTWFQPGSIEAEWKFELVGLLISLAVFNGLTLPITFPKALYRKLLGEPVTELHHIEDGWPELANGLTSLLEWDEKDGLVEDVFARTYEFSVSVFGQPVTRLMKSAPPNSPKATTGSSFSTASFMEGWPQFSKRSWLSSEDTSVNPGAPHPDDAPLVTNANRNAYVSDYIRYLTDVSVRPQFEAFSRGFRACLHPTSLNLLNSGLLQSVVEGVQEIDVGELRRYTRYVGWDASHRTVRDFWSIVKRYDDGMKRKLLEFVTASDRVPVGGMKNLQFVVQKNGTEDDPGGHLPTAYTCYGTLLLPEYRDKEVLRERLAMALQNAQGFGFA